MPTETVLLLHGFPQTAAVWRGLVPGLEASGYAVLAPELAGDAMIHDALAMAPERCHLVGHDVGGIAAWRLAAGYPNRWRSLTAISAPHPSAFTRASNGEGGSDQAQRTGHLDHFTAPGAEALFLADGGSGLRRLFAASAHTGNVEPYVSAMLEPGALDHALSWFRAEPPARVPEVTVPTLLVWGDEDALLSPEAAAFTADHVTGTYRCEVLAGAGHWIPDLVPDRLLPLLLAHLRSAA